MAKSGMLVLLLAVCQAWGAPEVIDLKGGARVRGEVLKEDGRRLIVDLGYTLLEIPRPEIRARRAEAGTGTDVVAPAGGLWTVAPDRAAMSLRENVRRCGPAVVEVRTPVGLGSGFIVNPDGYVVTNHHVIAGERRISITLFRQREQGLVKETFREVRIVAANAFADLALLAIEGVDEPLPVLPLAVDDELTQGQAVFGIGSPLGLERTVSEGIVSIPKRPIGGQVYIQTTTQINPGNSGGPLIDLHGRVVGVINMKVMVVGVEGVGFAIPIDRLKAFCEDRDAFAFDPRNPNAGFRYFEPIRREPPGDTPTKGPRK